MPDTAPCRMLTERQAQVAHGIGRDLTNGEIAAELRLSHYTVRNIVTALGLVFEGERRVRRRITRWVHQLEHRLGRPCTPEDLVQASASARQPGQKDPGRSGLAVRAIPLNRSG